MDQIFIFDDFCEGMPVHVHYVSAALAVKHAQFKVCPRLLAPPQFNSGRILVPRLFECTHA